MFGSLCDSLTYEKYECSINSYGYDDSDDAGISMAEPRLLAEAIRRNTFLTLIDLNDWGEYWANNSNDVKLKINKFLNEAMAKANAARGPDAPQLKLKLPT